ncbi:MAG: FAD-dependent oxidoreductase [Deltaproteobacteria bacterium]|nr:FAD-dependent oxidoreductase [Deltaproteobacteria bacterium]
MEGRTHRPVHDEARCSACSICVSLCPAVRYPEYRLTPHTVRGAVYASGALVPVVEEVRPCRAACPLHQDVPVYCGEVARGDASAALAVIRATNPLPAVCGTVCNRSCERACVRARVDQGVQIRATKRFAVEEVLRAGGAAAAVPGPPAGGLGTVAIVGSGPAGLAVAHDLAAAGARVTVFDDQPCVGGMLACAVPSFVMPRDLLAADVEAIRALGVEFRIGVRVGRDISLETLRRGHDAVVLAVGAWRGRPLGIAGERGLEDVVDHVEFARRVSLEGPRRRGGPAVVFGGSTAAVDCARIAVRLGCRPVTLAWRRPAERLPCDAETLADAIEEGVRVLELVRPTEVRAEGGRLCGVRFERLREDEPDAWGFRPLVPAEGGETLELPASLLVVAVDRAPDLRLLGGMPGLIRTALGFLAVDPATGMTALPGLFAAGEVVSGPKGAVEAVAAGRKVAAAVVAWTAAQPRRADVPAPASARTGGVERDPVAGPVGEAASNRTAGLSPRPSRAKPRAEARGSDPERPSRSRDRGGAPKQGAARGAKRSRQPAAVTTKRKR